MLDRNFNIFETEEFKTSVVDGHNELLTQGALGQAH